MKDLVIEIENSINGKFKEFVEMQCGCKKLLLTTKNLKKKIVSVEFHFENESELRENSPKLKIFIDFIK